MADLKINSGKLRGLASSLKSSATAYGTDIKGVYNVVGQLGSWEGSTSDAFVNRMNKLKPGLEELEKNINSWASALEKVASEYETMLAKIESSLNG